MMSDVGADDNPDADDQISIELTASFVTEIKQLQLLLQPDTFLSLAAATASSASASLSVIESASLASSTLPSSPDIVSVLFSIIIRNNVNCSILIWRRSYRQHST